MADYVGLERQNPKVEACPVIIHAGWLRIHRPFYAFALSRRRELMDCHDFTVVNQWLALDFRRPSGVAAEDWKQAGNMRRDWTPTPMQW